MYFFYLFVYMCDFVRVVYKSIIIQFAPQSIPENRPLPYVCVSLTRRCAVAIIALAVCGGAVGKGGDDDMLSVNHSSAFVEQQHSLVGSVYHP